MFPIANLRFNATTELSIALSLACAAIAISVLRQLSLPAVSRTLVALGAIVLALACGAPEYARRAAPRIAVIVDSSPSTRGASYLNDDRLQQRLRELLGTQARSVSTSADPRNLSPAADAILLFSDARIDLSTLARPTYVVVDPMLENPPDGAITRLSIDGDDVRVGVRNQAATDEPRRLSVEGAQASPSLPTGETLGNGSFLFRARREPSASTITAEIVGSDRWPENDRLSLVAPPPLDERVRWWVSDERPAPDSSWRAIRAGDLPLDGIAYLAPTIIVLDDQPIGAISPLAQQRIAQYVRELGGALIISGGERAFGAGGYFNSILDVISPLASAPPTPTRHWILLVDSSGSMAGEKWQRAVEATLRTLQALPSDDLVTVGSFAREVRWWSANRSVAETRAMQLPPRDVVANGPTNLQPALDQVITRQRGAALPAEILVLSDADAKTDDPDGIARELVAAKIRVSLLATGGDVPADNAVARIVQMTNGHVLPESDPLQWSARARELLLRAAMRDLIVRTEGTVTFAESTKLPTRSVNPRNRAWIKSDAQPIAMAADDVAGARWNVGAGRVIALAFPAESGEITTLGGQIAAVPRDPRFAVRREEGSALLITIDAADAGQFLNGLAAELVLHDESSASPSSISFAQTAPGLYELSVPAPRTGKLATITIDGRVIDRFALAGRYAPEFDAIGNDRDAMAELARRTGGRVIEPTDTQPIDIKGPERRIALTSELAFVGAALIAIGLIHWRRAT